MEQPPSEFDLELREPAVTGAPEAFGESFIGPPELETFELGEGLEGDPAIAFRRTLGMFATGVTVLTTRVAEQVHGMTANAFMSVSLRPPLVLVSVDRRARMNAHLHEGRRFGVNVLEAHQADLSDRFAGRVRDDVPEPAFVVVHDTPLIEGALAHLAARVVRSYWGGDHSLFLGQVDYAHYGEGEPLLFHGGRYERLRLLSADVEALARRIVAMLASGDLADVESLVGPDYVDHHGLGDEAIHGPEAFRRVVAATRTHADLRVEIVDLVVTGNRVALRLLWRGTGVDRETLDLLRFEHGRLVERRGAALP